MRKIGLAVLILLMISTLFGCSKETKQDGHAKEMTQTEIQVENEEDIQVENEKTIQEESKQIITSKGPEQDNNPTEPDQDNKQTEPKQDKNQTDPEPDKNQSASEQLVTTTQSTNTSGKIYLYGESHSVTVILDKELELWKHYYQNQGMRHLFIEFPYFTAQYLNLWMKSDNDEILDQLFLDFAGTAVDKPQTKEFYQSIKRECPETIFHGTDIGHQFGSTGKRYLAYLDEHDLTDSEEYQITQEVIDQGVYFYTHNDYAYRENKMVENFIREYKQIENESIMGIYGLAHTGIYSMDSTSTIPCMANQLNENYGDRLCSEDLTELMKDNDPERVDIISVGGKDYQASYFGKQDLISLLKGYSCREFWRLEDAYEDFKGNEKCSNVLPYNNYPMQIQEGQIFVIDYTKVNGEVEREYYISDGSVWNNMPTTVEIKAD